MEIAILNALQGIRFGGLTQLMALISALGNAGFIWSLSAVVMLFFARTRNAGLAVIISVILCGVVVDLVLTGFVDRVRPCDDPQVGITAVIGVSRTGMSFPSFHAASSAAAACAIALMAGKRNAVWAIPLAILICFSRLFCGVSYPSDMIAGALIGVLIALVVSWLLNQLLGSLLHGTSAPSLQNKRTSVGGGKHSRY